MTKFYTLLLLSFFWWSCNSASKSYQKGDYADAIELGVKKLQKDPGDTETREIIQNAYNFAVQERENRIRTLSNTKGDGRFEKIYQEYLRLQDLYETIRAYPVAARQIRATDYSEYVETYRDKTADIYIARAEERMSEGSKRAFRDAYQQYRNAVRYRPDDMQLKRKKDSVYLAALTKVLIVPIRQQGGYSYSNYYEIRNFQDDVLRTLEQSMSQDYVKFYSEWELRNKNIEPDQVMELNLGRFIIGQPFENRTVREVSKEVVVKETVYKPDSVVKQYATVRAKIITTQRVVVSEGELIIDLREPNGRPVWSDRFTGQHQWRTQYVTYTGDERALSESDKNQINQHNAYRELRQEEILEELFRQIRNDLSSRLGRYYRG